MLLRSNGTMHNNIHNIYYNIYCLTKGLQASLNRGVTINH